MRANHAALILFLIPSPAFAQSDASTVMGRPVDSGGGVPSLGFSETPAAPFAAFASPILGVPVTNLRIGAVPPAPEVKNPLADDPSTVTRGMRDFVAFNCVGCHAPNGGGGMGPALSEGIYTYGGSPANLFLTIYQGRPNGMPAWGRTLPESTIWELVAYVQSIGEKPGKTFGRTISRTPLSPDKQQVPAEYVQTTHPWSFTEAFTNGQKPSGE